MCLRRWSTSSPALLTGAIPAPSRRVCLKSLPRPSCAPTRKTAIRSRPANRRHPGAIPESVFEKPPSAELRPNQKDSDSLPPYEILDQVLRAYVEDYQAPRQIARNLGLPLETVVDIVN